MRVPKSPIPPAAHFEKTPGTAGRAPHVSAERYRAVPRGVSLQRIVLRPRNAGGAVPCCRVGASSFCKGEVLHARSTQQARMGVVSFVAARLVIDSVCRSEERRVGKE